LGDIAIRRIAGIKLLARGICKIKLGTIILLLRNILPGVDAISEIKITNIYNFDFIVCDVGLLP
jgi:hypothetical protein